MTKGRDGVRKDVSNEGICYGEREEGKEGKIERRIKGWRWCGQ